MLGQKWTKEEEARMFKLLDEGHSFSECGEILGRGKNSCISRAHRSGKYVATERKPVRRKKEKPVVEAVVIAFPAQQPKPPVPRYEQPEASTTAFGTPMALLDLQAHHCRWPVEERGGQRLFCCATRSGSGPYCCEHRLIAWRPVKTTASDLTRMARAYR